MSDGPDRTLLRRLGPGASAGLAHRTLAADSHFAAALLTLWHDVAIAGMDGTFGTDAERSDIAAAVAEVVRAIRAGTCFGVVATDGNAVVGAGLVARRGFGMRFGSGELKAVLVAPGRGGSAGDDLLEGALELAAEHGLHDVVVSTPGGSAAEQFYRARGFVRVGVLPGPGGTEVELRRSLREERGDGSRTERLVELSHVISDGMVTYPGIPAPRLGMHLSFEESAAHYAPGTEFQIATITLAANTGTYLDTPAHRYRDGPDLAGVPLDRLVDLAGAVVDVRAAVAGAPAIETLPLRGVAAGSAVLVHTGHATNWGTERYLAGHPYLTAAAVQQLLDAEVALVGIDSLNIDGTATGERPAHSALLAAGVPIVEHMTNLEALPGSGFRFFAAPPLIDGMGTFPVRAFAVVAG